MAAATAAATNGHPTPAQLYRKYRIDPPWQERAAWQRVTDAEARAALGFPVGISSNGHTRADLTGIALTGYDLSGQQRGAYQVRLDVPGPDGQRYSNRPKTAGPRWLNTTPGALKERDTLVLSESCKSSYAIASSAQRTGHRNIKPCDINGLSGWLERDPKTDESHPLADLQLAAGHPVVIVPDTNVWLPGRADLFAQLQRLCAHLEKLGASSVRVAKLYGREKGVNGGDDFLSVYTDGEFWTLVERAQPLWQYAFPTAQEFDGEELKADLLIDGLVANRSITILASPSENYKSSLACVLSAGMLGGKGKVCSHFNVLQRVSGVLYCCPDMSHEMLLKYTRQFGLNKFPNFRIRTMKQGPILYPDDPLLISAARAGYYIVFDTMNYFTGATDDNNPQELNNFIVRCRTLVDRYGSAGIMVLAHPTKTGVRSSDIDLTEWVAGTYAKIGNVDTILCLKKLPESADNPTPVAVYVSREKSRPFMGVRLEPFTLSLQDGKGSCLDRGEMPIRNLPGTAQLRELLPEKDKGGRRETFDKDAKIATALEYRNKVLKGKRMPTMTEIKDYVNLKHNSKHDEKTLRKWLKDYDKDMKDMAKAKEELTA